MSPKKEKRKQKESAKERPDSQNAVCGGAGSPSVESAGQAIIEEDDTLIQMEVGEADFLSEGKIDEHEAQEVTFNISRSRS